MKRLILILMCVVMIQSVCFAYAGVLGFGMPETTFEKTIWTIGSCTLLLAGIHTMNNYNDDITVGLTGTWVAAMGGIGLNYMFVYEF
ncbi:hypothetical protein LCGC14_0764690 [marine sediment metagenome]|uniref:Uncharacterized protein n=1 Tax=marine sediment metagenome TaxID=412755 RepID=A0A0F9SKA1_9ZZZZ